MPEVWKDIPAYDGYYQASTHGRIRSLDRYINQVSRNGKSYSRLMKGKVLKPISGPYLSIHLGKEVITTHQVHTLVLITFVGVAPYGHEARHLDGKAKNNCLSNLVWGTPKENSADKLLHGTAGRGSNHYRTSLSEHEAEAIKNAAAWYSGKRYGRNVAIAEQFGVTPGIVSAIANNSSWKHV